MCCSSPKTPHECFNFAALAFDLAERLQTPVFVMSDLDIGMNERLCKPFEWDDARRYDRGKVLSHEDLEAGKTFARYLDVDGDGIPYRTIPATHPTKGAYFTRGSTRNAQARYSGSRLRLRLQHGAPAPQTRHRGHLGAEGDRACGQPAHALRA